MEKKPVLSVVVPVFNEEAVIRTTHQRLKAVLDGCGEPYELLYVNDGSRDATVSIISGFCDGDDTVRLLSFARNFGHQIAITAGMEHAAGEAIVVIDADLQDPPEVILEMLAKWREGYQVVYGRRTARKGETAFKKLTASVFYRTLNALTDIRIPNDTGDFRLIDRRVKKVLCSMPERSRYVRGLVTWVGFKQTHVDFVREPRFAGETKYPLKKMLRFAMDAVVSFSDKPLKLPSWLGGLSIFLGLAGLLGLLISHIVTGASPLWLQINAPLFVLGGAGMVCLGVVGQYIGRIYNEAKGRPLYVIGETRGFDEPPEL